MESSLRSAIKSVRFSSYTKDEIESFSVLPVTNGSVFDRQGNPIDEGVYDPHFGALENNDRCPVCDQNAWNCIGHFGHIPLELPVYHPFYIKHLRQIMMGICLNCHDLRISQKHTNNTIDLLQLIARGHLVNADTLALIDPEDDDEKQAEIIRDLIQNTPEIEPNSFTISNRTQIMKEFLTKISSSTGKCQNCSASGIKIKYDQYHFQFQRVPTDPNQQPTPLTVLEVRKIINKFYKRNKTFFKTFFSDLGPDQFFIDTICVPPSKFRPASVLMDKVNAHPSSIALSDITKCNHALKNAIIKGDPDEISKVHVKLQNLVNTFFDSSLDKSGKKVPPGIRQVLEKKEGLFRKNLMGKRVNFSARSVIAPDPYIATDEIGVPEVFAKTLSYPERVTEFNKDRLSEMIINGTDKYPGANYITACDGRVYRLTGMEEQERRKYSKMLYAPPNGPMPMVVGRHVIDGDFVLINRQPTLHRVSILGMKCKILPNQKTLRMHYSNCASFNADFDGDEINLHLPQNELGRSEARNLSLSSIHYVTPTAGNPIRGLIQDHVDSGAMLTMKDKFLSQSEYHQFVFAAFGNEKNNHLQLLPPAIMVPCYLWTGKQVISTILLNLTKDQPLQLTSNSKFTSQLLSGSLEETSVCFYDSELMYGIIDKNQYGATTYGLVHSLFELYGSDLAGQFLTMLTRLFTFYMQTHGFTCGIDDMVITPKAEHIRNQLNQQMMEAAEEVAENFVNEFGSDSTLGLPLKERLFDLVMKPDLKERFDNQMKGKINKISTQIIKEIFPLQLKKPFPRNSMIMMTQSGAKGSVVNVSQISCLLGQQDLEGKRVPFMPSGKTLPSFDPLDLAPIAGGFISSRFITGLKPQEYYFHCMAGREGLTDTAVKTANTGYLQRCIIKHIEGLHAAYDGTVRNSDDSIIQFLYGEDGIDPMNNKYLTKFKFMEQNYEAYVSKLKIKELMEKVDCDSAMEMLDSKEKRESPIQSIYPPHRYIGSVSENFEKALNDYINSGESTLEPDTIRAIALFNYFRSIIQPGEVVGVIAAQAIGEPATQMTLNTFHLAGYGGTNVTLGIPRLREILIVATQTPTTPTMTIKMKSDDPEAAEKFVAEFKRIHLRDAVTKYKVCETLSTGTTIRRERRIEVTLFLNKKKLKDCHLNSEYSILRLRSAFAKSLKKKMTAIFKSTGSKITEIVNDTIAQTTTDINEKEERIKSRVEEMGADLTKKQTRKNEQNSYEADETEQDNNNNNNKENDEITDEGIQTKYDEGSAKLTVLYTVQNVSVKILLESIVESVLDEVMVHEVPGVKRANIDESNQHVGPITIMTEGVNWEEIIKRNDIDLNQFYTNDIAVIYEHYGIEAARAAIIKEVNAVFHAYGIAVDSRHLQLIADYVTQSGEWLGMSRHSMKSCPSPLQQMSFETTTQFLTHSTLHSDIDQMRSPSASLSVGNVIKLGTGLCEIRVPFE